MKISIIQMNIKAGESEYNYSHAKELLIKAAGNSPDVLVLPEMWNTGFFPKENLYELSDKNAVKTKALLKEISKKYRVSVIGGSVAETKNGKTYNTCFIYDKNGEEIASYSKTHLFSPMKENEYFEKGDSLCVFTLNGIKCAACICYDIRFPELVRRLALQGIKILFVPMQWPDKRISQMEILMKARAVENQIFTVCCNSSGAFSHTSFGGNSLICSPFGDSILKLGENEEIGTAVVDFSASDEIKSYMDVFSDRREELY